MYNKAAGKKDLELEKLLDTLYKRLEIEKRKKVYSAKDLKIIPENNFSVSKYKKDLTLALEPLLNIKEYELDSVALFIRNKDEKALEKIKNYINYYKQSILNLLKVPVTEELAPAHLSLINSYSKFVAALELIKKSENDIILAYPGLEEFMKAETEIQSAHDAIDLYLRTYGETWIKD